MQDIDELGKLIDADQNNYIWARGLLGETADLVQDATNLYQYFATSIECSSDISDVELLFVAQSILNCRYLLVTAAAMALRGHILEAVALSRRAIECTAFTVRSIDNPHLISVWNNAYESDQAHRKFRNETASKKLFPKEHSIMADLGERYRLACKTSHSSPVSVGSHLKFLGTKNCMEIQFHWNQSTEDGAEPARTILWVLSTHYQLLLAFEEALPRSAINKNSEWRKIMQSFKKKVEKQVVRLAPLL